MAPAMRAARNPSQKVQPMATARWLKTGRSPFVIGCSAWLGGDEVSQRSTGFTCRCTCIPPHPVIAKERNKHQSSSRSMSASSVCWSRLSLLHTRSHRIFCVPARTNQHALSTAPSYIHIDMTCSPKRTDATSRYLVLVFQLGSPGRVPPRAFRAGSRRRLRAHASRSSPRSPGAFACPFPCLSVRPPTAPTPSEAAERRLLLTC